MSDLAITARGLTKRFYLPMEHATTLQERFAHPIATSRHHVLLALYGVNLDVPKGEFLGITGPNGCGKSTLLRVLCGIYEPDAGSLRVSGRISPFLELGVGFKGELSARDNIVLGGTVLGLTRSQAAKRIDEVLDFAELTQFGDQKLRNFSSGMAVRLAFAVAALADADILLMDEVLAVGDAHFREKCFDVFWYYKRKKRTIVLVSHDLSALEQYCDRVVLMQDGAVTGDGRPTDVTRQYRQAVAAQSGAGSNAAAAQRARDGSLRRGSGEVEVVRCRLLSSTGVPRAAFTTGEAMVVAIDYQINASVGQLAGGFILKRADGHLIAVADTRKDSFTIAGAPAGTGRTLVFEVPELQLLNGSYSITVVFLGGDNNVLDEAEDIASFHVTDALGRVGVVNLGGHWREAALPEEAEVVASAAIDNNPG